MGRRLIRSSTRTPVIKDTWVEAGGRPPLADEGGCWVGLDPSIRKMGLVALGHRSYYWRLHKPTNDGGARLAAHRWMLADFFAHIPEPDLILIEGPGFESYELFSAGIVRALIVQAIWDLGLEDRLHPKPLAPNSLKKFVTNDGRADKKKVVRTVRSTWGITPRDHNVADAYALAQAAMTISTGQARYAWQRDVLRRMGPPRGAPDQH